MGMGGGKSERVTLALSADADRMEPRWERAHDWLPKYSGGRSKEDEERNRKWKDGRSRKLPFCVWDCQRGYCEGCCRGAVEVATFQVWRATKASAVLTRSDGHNC